MTDYPTTLPLPDRGQYNGVMDYGLQRTQVPAPLPSQISAYNSPTTTISMTFSMTNDTFTEWDTWVKENGYKWFNLPLVVGNLPDIITSVQRVRIISPYEKTKRGDNWLSVSVAMETVPGDILEADTAGRAYDIIVSGSPDVPSIDIIISETVANPPADVIQGDIYFYEVT